MKLNALLTVLVVAGASVAQGFKLCNQKAPGTFVRDPLHCGEFFMCRDGRPVRFSCPAGMNYDANTNTCGYGVFCDNNDLSWQLDESDLQTQYVPIETNPPLLDAVSGVCLGARLGSIRPDTKGCEAFYQCAGAGAIRFECPAGTAFDSNRLYCEVIDIASCQYAPQQQQQQQQQPPQQPSNLLHVLCFGKQIGLKYPHPMNCSQYVQCDGRNKAILFNCPRGTSYDRVRKVCGFSNSVSC
ncbi:probable endochitinase [Anopheles aquasalis]|uniref:probable endochitinase n=1 Tax=Anopheles aquasalis TaxID=42839 RepID=UPI00215AB2B3|nr:probable endochitinase [Anopheles aquasalis]